jgi:hypothetical protein
MARGEGFEEFKGFKGLKEFELLGSSSGQFLCREPSPTALTDSDPNATQKVPGAVCNETGKVQREMATIYCIRPRQATGQTAAITPARMPKSDSCRWTAWSV